MPPGEPSLIDVQAARAAVLGALNLLYAPMAADDLVMVTQLSEGFEVDEETLVELAEADRADFFAGVERPARICPAIEYADGKANDEFFTRSDWVMGARIVRDVLSESQELWLLWRFCDLAMSAVECGSTNSAAFARLGERIDGLTIHLPASRLAERRAEHGGPVDDLVVYRELAENLYGELVSQERVAQRHVVEAWERLAPAEKYFGVG